jgi:PAS domain S-box-containing protein
MVAASQQLRPDYSLHLQNILDEPEQPGLRRLTTLVGYLFHVPVAYLALLGAGSTVVARIGFGTEYAPYLKGVRRDKLIEEPQLVRDSASDLPAGTNFADLRFAASAVLHTTSGEQLGVLVIADRAPRPDFSETDIQALADLAAVFAGKMELRMVASMALECELSLHQTEQCFRGIAESAPVPLIYCRVDGSCWFVNQAWLGFTGRTPEQERAKGWVSLLHPDYRKSGLEEYWSAFEALRPFTVEAPLRRHDGQYLWMSSRGAPRFRGDGSFAGYVGCLIEITGAREAPVLEAGGAIRCHCGRLCPFTE